MSQTGKASIDVTFLLLLLQFYENLYPDGVLIASSAAGLPAHPLNLTEFFPASKRSVDIGSL